MDSESGAAEEESGEAEGQVEAQAEPEQVDGPQGQVAQEPETESRAATGPPPGSIPREGGRHALREVGRKLDEEDLEHRGVQKLLLDALDRCDRKRRELEGYVDRFHEEEKRAAVLEERLSSETTIEIMYGVGVGVGGAIVGIVPFLWTLKAIAGLAALILGGLLVGGAAYARGRQT